MRRFRDCLGVLNVECTYFRTRIEDYSVLCHVRYKSIVGNEIILRMV